MNTKGIKDKNIRRKTKRAIRKWRFYSLPPAFGSNRAFRQYYNAIATVIDSGRLSAINPFAEQLARLGEEHNPPEGWQARVLAEAKKGRPN